MKYLCTLLTILFLGFGMCVYAGVPPAQTETPEDVVKLLYRDFGWEITSDNSSRGIFIDQPLNVLERYFTPKLAELIVKDRKYSKRTKELGHIDFVLLCGSQDPEGISTIRITRTPGKDAAAVLYDQNGENDVMKIEFFVAKTGSGWRISDVRYKARKSTAFPDPGPELSLLKLLSQPY